MLRPKNEDYITRGLFLLLGWIVIGWVPFAFAGALLAGAGGAALGLFVSIPVGIALYWAYLEWSRRHA